MLDLSEKYIGSGDVVIFAPELNKQTLSMFFSATDMWRAVDGKFEMLCDLKNENISSMVGCFSGFVSEKYKYLQSGSVAEASGIYAKSSFDDNCDMKRADRAFNTMLSGYDANNPIELDEKLYEKSFVDYVNDYSEKIKRVGANLYYSFPPMNKAAISNYSEDNVTGLYEFIGSAFEFPIISNPFNYILDAGYFYDTNFHVNDSGMTVHSVNLLNDIKNQLGISAPTNIELPAAPEIPADDDGVEGNNRDEDCFVFGEDENGNCIITSLSEKGASRKNIEVPYSHNGRQIVAFNADVFAGNTVIEVIILQDNIATVFDRSFDGCTSLRNIFLRHKKPSEIKIGYEFLAGTEATINIYKSSIDAFKNDYSWSYYSSYMVGYED